jgi:hypothetical protein
VRGATARTSVGNGAEQNQQPHALYSFPASAASLLLSGCRVPSVARHMKQGELRIHDTSAAAGQGKAELLTGIEGVSSRPVRRIVLREG